MPNITQNNGHSHSSVSGSGPTSYTYRPRRTKTDWAGISVGDAFKPNLDYAIRLHAQRLYYRWTKKVQQVAARAAGTNVADGFEARTKPQLTPCYSSYPATLAAYASIGLTAFLEYRAWGNASSLALALQEYLQAPAERDQAKIDPAVYKKLAGLVVNTVQKRLLLQELAQIRSLSYVEIYRIYSASMQTLQFRAVPEIVEAVVLYSDLYPARKLIACHKMTQHIFNAIYTVSLPYFSRISETPAQQRLALGCEWVQGICRCLIPYLPAPDANTDPAHTLPQMPPSSPDTNGYHFENPKREPLVDADLPPLAGPHPPLLFEPPTPADQLKRSFLDRLWDSCDVIKELAPEEAPEDSIQREMEYFADVMQQAGGQTTDWEDMRSDLADTAVRNGIFEEGPIEGNPADGHEVTLELGDNESASGELFDRPVELSDDLLSYEKLQAESQEITNALRRSLYPNIEQLPAQERLCTGGSLDPARLAQVYSSAAVFKRWRIKEQADRRGRPLLVIACDGSASLNASQMQMLKVLTAAWLNSTTKTDIQILAGLYHSGSVRPGISGPLVQWLYHPRKTPATSRKNAARTLVTLPDTGTGAQADALSVGFIMQEALTLAGGKMIYLILITDCAWNHSFQTSRDGSEEMHALFESLYTAHGEKLHSTLVALGVSGPTGFEDQLDKVIAVAHAELHDPVTVAKKIGVYVATCLNERTKLVTRKSHVGS